MRLHQSFALAAIIAGLALASLTTARAADFGVATPAVPITEAQNERLYLARHAVLLMIRSTFNVVDQDLLAGELAAETRRIGAGGPTEDDEAALDRSLLLEGGYYLVSLRYLTQLGGALWPNDRPESNYANDALVTLDSLEQRLVDVVAQRADPLPLFEDAQRLLTLTEGLTKVQPENDRFAGRDAMVERVLAEAGPRTSI